MRPVVGAVQPQFIDPMSKDPGVLTVPEMGRVVDPHQQVSATSGTLRTIASAQWVGSGPAWSVRMLRILASRRRNNGNGTGVEVDVLDDSRWRALKDRR